MNNYQPIRCDFYDILEALATRRAKITVEFMDAAQLTIAEDVVITDLQTRNKEEFVYLDNGQVIRLDHLVKVNGIELPGVCGIE